MAYDKGISVFSPDGRLFQVEYAREAVKKGSTTIGVKYKGGVALIVDRRSMNKLIEPKSTEKIHQIDDYIGCATSGLVADARVLVDEARKAAQVHKVNYGENISVEMLVKKVCDHKQNYTQYGGARPFGTALLVAGSDDLGVHLFETDPSGALIAFKATCIGIGRNAAIEVLEKDYEDDMEYEEAMKLGLKTLEAAIEEEPKAECVEIGIAEEGKKFRRLSEEEIADLMGSD
ncbi:MAG: archaeal proteasome endopeptidase complex subunit alpha [Candidatus Methanomethylophilaceae archaeon]|jgi:proteasome alpha subunit|nr:archaeal proteasome endopeptidase complex subunit alpha [Candidatus Methanomethylophilaceae archaeon]MBR3476379.1 archaeal proteasome endopeptidase complex subunit alpha [Candidatus Methanomethylophilaceae archaeon]MBR4181678.1 archaeal proteasome endopeptidase complex subunit alpha [Candidatus Methanomethylophilaceae archaeon]MBR4216458.1 archaeal proteasome endopeptidase complex subunit alpha [Candidatus Methanomethylophilaceae archaeon]